MRQKDDILICGTMRGPESAQSERSVQRSSSTLSEQEVSGRRVCGPRRSGGAAGAYFLYVPLRRVARSKIGLLCLLLLPINFIDPQQRVKTTKKQ